MKTVLHIIVLASTLLLVGCLGLGDFKKYPPGPDLLWSKPGLTDKDLYDDLKACSDKAHAEGINPGITSVHHREACMLEKGGGFKSEVQRLPI